jgi:hypothetical protein
MEPIITISAIAFIIGAGASLLKKIVTNGKWKAYEASKADVDRRLKNIENEIIRETKKWDNRYIKESLWL